MKMSQNPSPGLGKLVFPRSYKSFELSVPGRQNVFPLSVVCLPGGALSSPPEQRWPLGSLPLPGGPQPVGASGGPVPTAEPASVSGLGAQQRAIGSIDSFASCSCSRFLPLRGPRASSGNRELSPAPQGGRLRALSKAGLCRPVRKCGWSARKLLLRQQQQSSSSSSWLLTAGEDSISLFLRFPDALTCQ